VNHSDKIFFHEKDNMQYIRRVRQNRYRP